MASVWGITEADDEGGYTVECILLSEDEANKLCDKMNKINDWYEVREFPVHVGSWQEPVTELQMTFVQWHPNADPIETEHVYQRWPWQARVKPVGEEIRGNAFVVGGADHELVRTRYAEIRQRLTELATDPSNWGQV